MEQQSKPVLAYINPTLWKRLKSIAALQGLHLYQALEKAIEEYILRSKEGKEGDAQV
jgi:hypothetical protein